MGSVDTPDNLRHVRPQHRISQSPHTPVQPTPLMGLVSTPDNLRHVRPEHHITNLPIRRYNQRHSNDVRIEIREILRIRDNLRISSRHNATFSTVLTRRRTGRQRVGAQSYNSSPENLKTTAPNSYPRYNTLFGATFVLGPIPKSGRKWPIAAAEVRPTFNSKIELVTLRIDLILPNHQLEHAEGMNFHTLIARNGGRRREIGADEVRATSGRKSPFFGGWSGGRCRGRAAS
ncbi:hypothetical protein L3X38_004725 [Prunus dulcis]|uniref:Uncharacterized protein n=1 Tax=Prunus dulcis TaxID=3755 RepID=A0AAD4ZPJ7_PRUDU|nr:hypothetical protein L3X38_004725 [Prunus dulcis]